MYTQFDAFGGQQKKKKLTRPFGGKPTRVGSHPQVPKRKKKKKKLMVKRQDLYASKINR